MTRSPTAIPLRVDYSARPRVSDAFACSVYARVQAAAHHRDALEFVPKDDKLTPQILTRADQIVGSTTVSGWAAQLVENAWREYLISLSPYSGAARLIEQAVQADGHSVNEQYFPIRTAGATPPGFVAEGSSIPVSSGAVSLVTLGPLKKLATILAWSRELGKRSDSERVLKQMLAEDTAAGLDAAFFSGAAADSTRPAGLLNGVVALSGFAGADEQAVLADLSALNDAVSAAGSGSVTYIAAPARVGRLRLLAPLIASDLDIVASSVIPAGRIIAVDARSLIIAVDPEPEVTVSKAGALHMSDVPLELVSGTPTVADPVRDLWSTASLAVRLIYEISFAKRRSGAAAFLDGCTW